MSQVLGIHIERDGMAATLVRDGRVAATWDGSLNGERDLESALSEMFAAMPSPGWRPPVVHASLGAQSCTTKCITGLPPVADTRELPAIVREAASRFFVGEPGTRYVAAIPHGSLVLAESYDRDVVEALCASAARARYARLLVMSSAGAVAQAVRNGMVSYFDDGLCQTLDCREGRIFTASRRPSGAGPLAEPRFDGIGALIALEPRFRVAAAAALANPGVCPSLLVLGHSRGVSPRWRARLSIASLLAAGALFAASPLLAYRAESARSSSRLRNLAGEYSSALDAQRGLARASATLRAIGDFQHVPATATVGLAAINRALPDASALVAFAMDSAGGSLVTIAERIVDAIGALDSAHEITAVEVSGPITRERIADRDLERATIRFRWSSSR